MSRVGRKPIAIPSGVEVNINGSEVTVKGPKGTITRRFHSDINISLEDGQLIVTRPSDEKLHRALHGTTRSLLSNMIEGVTSGFQKGLDIVGVGYRASMQGNKLVLALGYSHPVEYTPEPGIQIEVPSQTKILVKGVDKERVGAVAAKIRSYREPEPYKGKGIKYEDEVIRRKEGKTGKKK
jgi:large subunit ribosomal protein L6